MNEFLASNEWYWRLARTILQGVLGVVIANIDLIMDWCVLDPSVRAWSWRLEDLFLTFPQAN